MILVDSSVWIDFFRGRSTAATDILAQLLDEAAAPLAIADLALFEVLRGFRFERDYLAAERVLRALEVVQVGGTELCRAAAQHYRELRASGKTHPHATRILARSWTHIIWRCWQDNTPYDPTRHGGHQRLNNKAA